MFQTCKQVETSLFTSCGQDDFKLLVQNCRNKFGTSCSRTTVAHSCHTIYLVYIKLQFIHIKLKLLTSNYNCSHQITIAHIKLQLLTSNYNCSHQITIHSHQIKIAHIKLKLLTSNYNSFTSN